MNLRDSCGICGDEILIYEKAVCANHGRVCENCIIKCAECETERCPKCVIEYGGELFCDGGCYERYLNRPIRLESEVRDV